MAVTALGGVEPQRERLTKAYVSLMSLRAKDLPVEIRSDFELLMRGVVSSSLGGPKLVAQRKIDFLNEVEVSTMISSIIHMYDITASYQPLIPTDKRKLAV